MTVVLFILFNALHLIAAFAIKRYFAHLSTPVVAVAYIVLAASLLNFGSMFLRVYV
ncbi:hypothetical protein SAMN05518684_102135 [Salipaludibacillus aurantiacus]|uniref:Uncharacterized protein n=1 Tax=Salipaludibacillus aurantiacus TaxID=1601833 RepID=A0A1H9QBD2_9BACI|nr:hypothetical protein SAMN05518684_102135 [Salipaludibacillus aurantiacus]